MGEIYKPNTGKRGCRANHVRYIRLQERPKDRDIFRNDLYISGRPRGIAVKKILVVDDEAMILEVFHEALKRAGYSVVCARSGYEALEVLKEEKIEVMFLDLNMPGMDGVELCRTIRMSQPDAFIFAVTGYASFYSNKGCRKAGFYDFFTKPIDLAFLNKAAEDAFNMLDERRVALD